MQSYREELAQQDIRDRHQLVCVEWWAASLIFARVIDGDSSFFLGAVGRVLYNTAISKGVPIVFAVAYFIVLYKNKRGSNYIPHQVVCWVMFLMQKIADEIHYLS